MGTQIFEDRLVARVLALHPSMKGGLKFVSNSLRSSRPSRFAINDKRQTWQSKRNCQLYDTCINRSGQYAAGQIPIKAVTGTKLKRHSWHLISYPT